MAQTDPDWVKEARGEAWHPSQFARHRSGYTRHTRDLSKRIRARERREMKRIIQDLAAWGDYYPTGSSIIHEFDTATNAHAWFGY